MKKTISILSVVFFGLAISLTGLGLGTAAAGPTKAELNAAKKKMDADSVTHAAAQRAAYGREADEANLESTESKEKTIGSGNSTYGVVGFDYLTGTGKIASSIKGTNLEKGNPLAKLINKRFKHKWTGKANKTYSGWAEKTGVTEVWNRGKKHSKLGGDYNEWVNQWNIPTRPQTHGKTLIAGADPDQGAHWFSFYCIHCHGWTGKGDGPTAAALDPRPRNQTNGKYMNNISNLDLFTVIKGGGLARNLSNSMPPWGNVLQDQDIWNVVAFLRTLAVPAFKPKAGEVTAANASKSDEFKEMNDGLELAGIMAGRGGGQKGGYSSIGGGRLASKRVGIGGQLSSAVGTNMATGDRDLGK